MGVFALPVARVAWLSDLYCLDHRPHRLAVPGGLVGLTGGAGTGPGVGASACSSHSEVGLKRMIRTPLWACGSWPWTTRGRLPTSALPTGVPTGPAAVRCAQHEP